MTDIAELEERLAVAYENANTAEIEELEYLVDEYWRTQE